MRLRTFILLLLAVAAHAVPAKKAAMMAKTDDMIAEEGRSHASYSAPFPAPVAHAPQRPAHGSVTSYNRRGPAAGPSYPHHDGGFPKPAAYGPVHRAPLTIKAQPSIRAPVSYSGPTNYAPHHQQPAPVVGYRSALGPQKNTYSAQSQYHSQDPNYDPAKDPVSQYSDYIPVREYGPKGVHSDGRELSLYGYKK